MDDVQVIYTDPDNTVETITESADETTQTISIIESGPQGPPGETVETDATILCKTALAMSGHRFIVLDDDSAVYADCTILDHSHRVIGMTTGASNAGAVSVQTKGLHEEPTWSWTLGQPIFLSTTGFMTQIAPTSGFSLVLGFPVTSTQIFIKIGQPIILS